SAIVAGAVSAACQLKNQSVEAASNSKSDPTEERAFEAEGDIPIQGSVDDPKEAASTDAEEGSQDDSAEGHPYNLAEFEEHGGTQWRKEPAPTSKQSFAAGHQTSQQPSRRESGAHETILATTVPFWAARVGCFGSAFHARRFVEDSRQQARFPDAGSWQRDA